MDVSEQLKEITEVSKSVVAVTLSAWAGVLSKTDALERALEEKDKFLLAKTEEAQKRNQGLLTKDEYLKKINHLNDTIARLKSEKQLGSSMLETMESNLRDAEKTLASSSQQLADAKEKLATVTKELLGKQSEIENTNAKLDSAKTKVQETIKRKIDVENRVASKKKNIDSLKQERQDLRDSIKHEREVLAKIYADFDNTKRRGEKIKGKIDESLFELYTISKET